MKTLQEYLHPVDESMIHLHPNSIGNKVKLYWKNKLNENSIAIIGCPDLRGSLCSKEYSNIRLIRKELYELIWNDWDIDLYDLGDIAPGKDWEDTNFALQRVIEVLLKMKVFPIVLGGSISLNLSIYKALSKLDKPLNYTAIDSKIEINNSIEVNTDKNYLYQMMLQEPSLLFNFVNIGYQSYFVSKSTLKILNSIDFEGYRLGDISENIKNSEPVFRSSDFIAINLDSIESIDGSLSSGSTPNGFTNREICTLTKYVGLSKQIKILGIFNFLGYSHNKMNEKLVSQMLWYFIEGKNQQQYYENEEYIKYIVLHEDKELIFLKDKYVDKWWLAVNFEYEKKSTFLVPCSEKDYKEALKGNIPERYWKTFKRFL